MDYAVIMAGGTGKRLWPLSREKRPKQVLRLLDGQTLLRKCFHRLAPIFDTRNIIVLTNAGYADVVRENLPEIPYNNVIAEPVVRDTVGAVGLAAAILTKSDADATMAVVTADQLIEPEEVFRQALEDALYFINKNPDDLFTFGIKPSFAATQYGYIKCAKPAAVAGCKNKLCTVESFKEKPNEAAAEEYLKGGGYFWNSGIFVWKACTILAGIEKSLPGATEPLKNIHAAWDGPQQQAVLQQWFPKLPKISIDFAVMEKAQNVFAIQLDCRWLDLGSFAALADVISSDENNNIVISDASELLDCRDSVFVTEEKGHLIAAIGLDQIVVAHSHNATLICHADQTHRIKELLELIEKSTGQKFL